MMSMKLIMLIHGYLMLTAAGAWAQFSDGFDYQALKGSIQKTIEQTVGAKSQDRIPGETNLLSSFSTIKTEAIECPTNISDVKQAADLLQASLASDFTNRVVSLNRISIPRQADTTQVYASLCDSKLTNKVVLVTITISKRSSGHVILFLSYSAGIDRGRG